MTAAIGSTADILSSCSLYKYKYNIIFMFIYLTLSFHGSHSSSNWFFFSFQPIRAVVRQHIQPTKKSVKSGTWWTNRQALVWFVWLYRFSPYVALYFHIVVVLMDVIVVKTLFVFWARAPDWRTLSPFSATAHGERGLCVKLWWETAIPCL